MSQGHLHFARRAHDPDHRRHAGHRRRGRNGMCGGGCCGCCHHRAQHRARRRLSLLSLSKAGVKASFAAGDLANEADCRRIVARIRASARHHRRPRQRRRTDRSRHARRHQRRTLGPVVRGQCPRALHPDAGDRATPAGHEETGLDSQHHHPLKPWRTAVLDRVLGLKGRARHADQEQRPRAAPPSHPRQRPQYRLG